jgi:hypothetical protein
MRTDLHGDAFIYAKDMAHIVIFRKHQAAQTITVYPPDGGITWQEFTERICRPALLAEGWSLSNWHRPRGNQELYATAFIWKTDN